MTAFQQYADTPYQITNEGREVTVRFDRTGPTTGRVSWNLPQKTAGCSSDNPPAYQGMLITIDETHTSQSKTPVDGSQYVPDPTGDRNIHMGDKIGTALVVAFIRNRETTFVDINNLESNKAYFVSAHAMDGVYRYFTAGVHSYSTEFGDEFAAGEPATQTIRVGQPTVGVQLIDSTGFEVGTTYTLDMVLDNDEKLTYTFIGDNILTYGDLINEWNRQAKLFGNPLQSPMTPNTGIYYFNRITRELMRWTGSEYVEESVFVDDDNPNNQLTGNYWLNSSSGVLNIWSGSAWVPASVSNMTKQPNDIQCGDFWFDGSEMYTWNGTVWLPTLEITSILDPSLPPVLTCNTHWFNENDNTLYKLDKKCEKWVQTLAQVFDVDPNTPTIGMLWFDEDDNTLSVWNGSSWEAEVVTISDTAPLTSNIDDYWYNPTDMELYKFDGSVFLVAEVFVWHLDPTDQVAGALWWNTTSDELFQWSETQDMWVSVVPFFIGINDPMNPPFIEIGNIWLNSELVAREWDGSEWITKQFINSATNPQSLDFSTIVWFNTSDNTYNTFNGTVWNELLPIVSDNDPFVPTLGDFWFDLTNLQLFQYDGILWNTLPFSTSDVKPQTGYRYYDTTLNELREWNGYGWINGEAKYFVELTSSGQTIRLTTAKVGSYARVDVGDSNPIPDFFLAMTPSAQPLVSRRGTDPQSTVPSYAEHGVGTDGSEDERRELIDSIRHQLGYPTVEVELTKQQFNYCVDAAIESLRKRSGMAYKKGFYFLDIDPDQQQFKLTDKRIGFNKIVEVVKLHRVTSAFLNNAEGQGVYGQLALQHLYQMGTFDLISYHLVSQYVETMEHLFASQITFSWNEDDRTLSIYKHFRRRERVLMEVVVERTEQQMIKDRYLKGWIEKYATMQARLILSEIRGKYASLPGAGGGVALNAGELSARADSELMNLYEQLDDYLANNPEDYGMGSTFILG